MSLGIAFATFTFGALVLFFPIVRFIVIKMSTTHGAALFPELKGFSVLYIALIQRGEKGETPE